MQADAVDLLTMRIAPKVAAGAKKGKGGNVDDEEGESTEEAESLEQYEERLGLWISLSLKRGKSEGRDEYNNSGIVYDKRRKVMGEFLKSLTKKKCEKCGA